MSDVTSPRALDSTPRPDLDRPSCAVLVLSCDAYRDLWTPFFTLFWRHWPDCPFPVCLGTNTARYADPRVTSLLAGHHAWSKCLRTYLDQIDSKYVLLLLEDYFFTQPISTQDIACNLRALDTLGGIVLRLYPLPGPDHSIDGYNTIGRIDRLASYRVSLQAAIWNRSSLSELLCEDETAWDFERRGSIRSQARPDGFYSTYKAVLPYQQVIERGEWFRSAAKYFSKQGIACDFDARPIMSPTTAIKKSVVGRFKSSLDRILPARFRLRA